MKNNRLSLLVFVSVSYVFLCGSNHLPTSPNLKKHHTVKPAADIVDKPRIDDGKELQRPLDLTVPLNNAKEVEENPHAADKNNDTQNAVDALFLPQPKKEEQPLQLKGGWLMSPEPEPEKRKSVDGAGIMIDLKP
ncbi:MAG: hypothetical protein Q7U57_02620 [Methylovulum sp.]|nr:hypothetical protein [Methylovulum sp.]